MNTTLPITIAYSIIIILIIFVMIFTFVMVINKNIEMIYVLRPYLYALEDKGTLSSSQKVDIEEKLKNIGINNVIIEVDDKDKGFGDIIAVSIIGDSEFRWIIGFLKHESKKIVYEYKRDIIVKKVVN